MQNENIDLEGSAPTGAERTTSTGTRVGHAATLVSLKISDIHIGARIRQVIPDVTSLAVSMQRRGLLQPILVFKKDLIAGQRRIEAAKQLGWTHIDAYSVTSLEEALDRLAAELEENTEREPLAPGEIVEAAKKLEPVEKAEAEKRKAEGQKSGGRGRKKKLGGKKPSSFKEKRRTRSRVGRAYGAPVL
jgi:ParB family chromosome partitioning protein